LIQDFFRHKCDIYRVQGFTNYDYSGATEGEITETWGIVSLDVACRFEPEDGAFQRRSDGVADIGDHEFFVGPEVDIQNADRVYRALGELGPDFFEVTAVTFTRDFHDRLHHKEVRLGHIDWSMPETAMLWVPTGVVPYVIVQKTTFDYRDSQKIMANILLGYWLKSVAIQILVPFDDPGANISVSDSSEELVANDVIDMTIAGSYDETVISKQYSFNDDITMTLDPGASTQGSGVIFTQVIIG
jgi:hypothetical protein